MGLCWTCGSDIKLKKGELHCDNCGNLVEYKCWSCKKHIDIENVKEILNSKECSWCGFFFCPNCLRCGTECDRPKWIIDMREQKLKLNEIIQYLGNIKKGKYQSVCPRNVPWTYAKKTNKQYLLKMLGHRTKNINDIDKFKKRYIEITEQPINETWIINDIRDNGTHGIEDREACNLATCFGDLKHIRKKKKDSDSIYSLYERIDGKPCDNFDDKDLIIKQCPKCKKKYGQEVILCQDDGCRYKKGDKSGQTPYLKFKISNKQICKLHRNKFKQKKEVYENSNI